jgi:hypothetical protein
MAKNPGMFARRINITRCISNNNRHFSGVFVLGNVFNRIFGAFHSSKKGSSEKRKVQGTCFFYFLFVYLYNAIGNMETTGLRLL